MAMRYQRATADRDAALAQARPETQLDVPAVVAAPS